MTFTCAIAHQKHLAQSGHSTLSAVDIFNTLPVFTKEPIREQEIKLECMNTIQECMVHYCTFDELVGPQEYLYIIFLISNKHAFPIHTSFLGLCPKSRKIEPKNLKGESGLFFTHVNAMEQWPF